MKLTNKLLAFAFSGFMAASCNKKPQATVLGKAKSVETSQVPAPVKKKQNFYPCQNPQLPFFMIFTHPLGAHYISDDEGCWTMASNIKYDPRIKEDYKNKIGNYADQNDIHSLSDGTIQVSMKPVGDNSSRYPQTEDPRFVYNEDKPLWCFEEAKKIQRTYEIQLQGLTEQADGSFKKEILLADLYVAREFGYPGVDDDITYPEGSFHEFQYIAPRIPLNAKGVQLYVEVEYAAIVNSEPEHHKEAKRKLNLDLCRAARSFTWVFFRNPGPPDWNQVPKELFAHSTVSGQ